MSANLRQSPPEACTRVVQFEAVPVQWTRLDPCVGSGVGSSWIQQDESEQSGVRPHINWNAISSMAISFAISAGFWAGVGLLISRVV